MKSKFSNFYSNQTIDNTELKRIWSSKDTIFIFDTNTLLDLYRYRKETQNEFFKQLENIKSNIWMPYHVGLEFHNNRLKVIKQNKDKNKEIDSLKDLFNIDLKQLSTFQDKYKKADHPDLYEKIEELKNTLKVKKKEADTLIESAKEQMKEILSTDSKLEPNFLAHKDKIVEKISYIFSEDKIGNNLYNSQEKLDNLFETAKQRWSKEIPPGYIDYIEKKDKHFFYDSLKYYNSLGDLIIFNEIIHISSNKKHILFISNDSKSDWKMNIDYEGQKDLGIRPELRNELMHHNPNVMLFEILTTEQFIEKANLVTGDTIGQGIIQDIKQKEVKINTQSFVAIEGYNTELKKFVSLQDKIANIEEFIHNLNIQKENIYIEIQSINIDIENSKSKLQDLDEILNNTFDTQKAMAIHLKQIDFIDLIEKKETELNLLNKKRLSLERRIQSLTKEYLTLKDQQLF